METHAGMRGNELLPLTPFNFRSLPGSVQTIIEAADSLMYEEKKAGKTW